MKFFCGTTGMLLLFFGTNLPLFEQGVVVASLFLGVCLCLGALAITAQPLLERIVAANEVAHYVRQQEIRERSRHLLQIPLDKENEI